MKQRKGADLYGVRLSEWLAKEFVILGMRSDPEPLDSLWNWNAKGAVMSTDPDAAEAPAMYGFESQGRMRWILLEKSVIASSEALDVGRQSIEAAPKLT